MSKSKRIAVALENIHMQLRRRNDMTEAFQREVVDVLTRITEDPFEAPHTSGTHSGEAGCRVCGKPGECIEGPLTSEQWRSHLRETASRAPEWAKTDLERHNWAVGPVTARFGDCPEEP